MSHLPDLPPPEGGLPDAALADYTRLYRAARLVNAARPWSRIRKDNLFAVVNPEDGETGFVGVTGGDEDDHYAVMVYLGIQGLYTFWEALIAPGFQAIRLHFEAPMLCVYYESRKAMDTDDVNLIKSLGMTFRGANQWPVVRAVQPGFVGEIPTPAQSRFLAVALEQLLEVLARLDSTPGLLQQASDVDYLTRIPRLLEGRLVWKDAVLSYPPMELRFKPDIIPFGLLRNWMSCQPGGPVEVGLYITPLKQKLDNQRIRVLYVLLIVDAHSGMILSQDILWAEPTLEAMWNAAAARAVALLVNIGLRPDEIRARHAALLQGLETLPEAVGVKVVESESLPQADYAIQELLTNMMEDRAGGL